MTFTGDLPCSVLTCALSSMHIGPWSKCNFLKIRFIDDTLQNTVCIKKKKKKLHQMLEHFQFHENKTEFQSHLRWGLWRPCISALLRAFVEFPKRKLLDFPFCTGWLWRWHRGWAAEVGSLQWSLAPGVQCGGSGSGSYWRTRWTPEMRSGFHFLNFWTHKVMFLFIKTGPSVRLLTQQDDAANFSHWNLSHLV